MSGRDHEGVCQLPRNQLPLPLMVWDCLSVGLRLTTEAMVLGTGCGLPCALLSVTNSHSLPCLSIADDGKLSLEEFQLFFADGVLNEKELEGLFHTIDSDNTE